MTCLVASGRVLEQLAPEVDAGFRAAINAKKSRYHQNTRTEIFELLDHWLAGTGSEWKGKHTFYMWGYAGIGKSTIAVEYCRRLHESGHLGASFFFTRGAQGLESTDHVFPSIAAQLAYSQPALYEPIVSAADEI